MAINNFEVRLLIIYWVILGMAIEHADEIIVTNIIIANHRQYRR